MSYYAGEYDIAVIGAGHAGCEAALASARLGKRTLMFSISLEAIANMPCNPHIGGSSKGHLVREIDALGGEMGKNIDKTFIQIKMLNKSKGPAVYSLRAQADRKLYHIEMKNTLENQENLFIKQAEITKIQVEDGRVKSIETNIGAIYNVKAVILATGTYLKGKIHIGEVSFESGPDGVFPANELSNCLKDLGIDLLRFKTGTPARINKNSIDFSKMELQEGDKEIEMFSFEDDIINRKQEPCYLTYTNEETHKIIRENLHRSPLYAGKIEGTGPRYCPSIEDKVVRFADKERHQIFVEPIGEKTNEMYIQGMSSSLPEDVQIAMYRTIPGYEEAAAQGIIAGINAARSLDNKKPIILRRDEAYIGVLIDDIVTKSTNEPYRMMTSRAEYRLLLRQDNADLRLTDIGYEVGLISENRYQNFCKKRENITKEIERVKKKTIKPSKEVNELLQGLGTSKIDTGIKLSDLLKRTELTYENLEPIDDERPNLTKMEKEEVQIQVKYEGYINLQLAQVEKASKLEGKELSQDIEYSKIKGLRLEARQKLDRFKPISVGQASRISGVSPADISVLLIFLEQQKKSQNK